MDERLTMCKGFAIDVSSCSYRADIGSRWPFTRHSLYISVPRSGQLTKARRIKKASRNITLQETKLLEKTFFSIHISITCTLSDENEECKRDLFLILL